MRLVTAVLALAAGLAPTAASGSAPVDPHSYARPAQVRVVHVDLDLEILFDEKVLQGSAALRLARSPEGAGVPLRLDTRDLTILGVEAGRGDAPMREATWALGTRDPILGSELIIKAADDADRVRVRYRTSPDATGLQWLNPPQTAGGKHPFLYSQSQSIHARSWIPCQDSPGVRVTFDATVKVTRPLVAVMAAERVTSGSPAAGIFLFRMPHPIPSYLIAIAAGDLVFGQVSQRTGIWAEPSVLSAALFEFADMEKLLRAAERTYGPYRWGRYDLLILPPSFPFGGMENPMLTFATPTILAGDRSLVALVAHELAHSWSGNLVTNATWSDFWLNEGFTTYIEHRIMETVYGRERSEMEWMLARQDLEKEFGTLADKPADQALRIPLAGRDPDESPTSAPYDKGSLLLRLLEETYGREVFDPFLRSWFDEHAFTSVTTDDFLAFLRERLIGRARPLPGRALPDLAAWIDGPGIPAGAPSARSDAFSRVQLQTERWAGAQASARQLDTAGWVFHQWLHFLRALSGKLTPARMEELDAAFGFTRTGNSEILDEWLVLAARHGYEPAYRRLEQFLTTVGRQKYLKPIYQELMKTKAGAARARAIYAKARPVYQSMVRRSLDGIVGWGAPAGRTPS